MTKNKKEEFLEENTELIVPKTNNQDLAKYDCCGVDLTGVNPGDCGAIPWVKMDRKEGCIAGSGTQLLTRDTTVSLLVFGNKTKEFEAYDSIQVEVRGKKMYIPRAVYKNAEGKFASAEAEAVAAGETVPNPDGSWPNNVAPTAVPTINLMVLFEHELGTVAIAGRYFTKAMINLRKKDYYGVASKYFSGVIELGKRPGFAPWLLEFSVSVTEKDKYDNYYLQSRLIKYHQPDSEFGKAATDIFT